MNGSEKIEKINTCLCVGGPYDGKRYDADGRPQFSVMVKQPMPIGVTPSTEISAKAEVVLYTELWVNFEEEAIGVYAPDNMSSADVYMRLLENYKPEPAHEPI